jgi:hypothetical protein
VDDSLEPHADQWHFLSHVERVVHLAEREGGRRMAVRVTRLSARTPDQPWQRSWPALRTPRQR